MSSPSPPCRRGWPSAVTRGPDMVDHLQSIESLLAWSERDMAAGLMDAPWPPVYPKQPNEPPRVAPSRAKKDPTDPPSDHHGPGSGTSCQARSGQVGSSWVGAGFEGGQGLGEHLVGGGWSGLFTTRLGDGSPASLWWLDGKDSAGREEQRQQGGAREYLACALLGY